MEQENNAIPNGIKGWSWGAFLLNWIWAIGNRTWIGLLAIIPYVGFVMAIILGIKGREWAWKNGYWKSVDHFNHIQKKWSFWGMMIVVVVFIIGILAVIALPAYQGYIIRAKVTEGLNLAVHAEILVTQNAKNGFANLGQGFTFSQAKTNVSSVVVAPGTGIITITYNNPPIPSADKAALVITLTPNADDAPITGSTVTKRSIIWTCQVNNDLLNRYVPSNCRI